MSDLRYFLKTHEEMIVTSIEVIDAAAELTFGWDKLGARIAATLKSWRFTIVPVTKKDTRSLSAGLKGGVNNQA